MTSGKNKIVFVILLLLITINVFSFYQSNYTPYQGLTKKITTEHFVILFPEKFLKTAKKTAVYAEDIHKNLADFYNWKPYTKTIIVISDETDFPNGSALPFFRNVITLYAVNSDYEPSLRSYDDPLYSLIVHEYSHILQFDQIRGGVWFWRVMYGKLYHPLLNTFRWYMEGTAVLSESTNAGGGRLNSEYTDAIIREAAKNNKIPSYDKLIFPVVDWPHGDAVYLYGARFMEYVYTKYGQERYKAFMTDMSDDFWPFVLLFVMKFKKIYGVSLNDLWNEWRSYETSNAAKIVKSDIITLKNKLTNLEGEITAIVEGKDCFYFSNTSYKNDNYLYKLSSDNKLIKLHYGYHRSLSLTNDENYILYTTPVVYPDNTYYFDLYSLNLKTKISKKLTNRLRVGYISFAKNNSKGVMTVNSGENIKLYKADFISNKIINIENIDLPEDIEFVDNPSINDDGSKIVFSARVKNQLFKIFILDINTGNLTLVENIYGQKARWIDENNISFVCKSGYTDLLMGYDIQNKTVYKVVDNAACVFDGLIANDKAYYIDYTASGTELFVSDKNQAPVKLDSQIVVKDYQNLEFNQNWKINYYSGFEYLYPSIWGFLPYQLNSNAYFMIPNYRIFTLPFIGPQFFLYNITPLGRFSYYATVACDYLKLYPDNSFGFNINLPFFNIGYNWNNYAGGVKHFVIDRFYEIKHDNKFPICFDNTLSLSASYPLVGKGELSWELSSTHYFNEYNFNLDKHYTNEFVFLESLEYSFIKSRSKASRWDRGFYIDLIAYQKPTNILDNVSLYLLKGQISGRVPFGNAFYFLDIQGGVELLNSNSFTCYSESFRFSESFVGNGNYNSVTKIDMKAFTASNLSESRSGSKYISFDTGFDITYLKKSMYLHFLSFGFRELYSRIFCEFTYLYNNQYKSNQEYGILFDIASELTADFFVDYGEISFEMTLGASVGYAIGNTKPNYNIYYYLSFGL